MKKFICGLWVAVVVAVVVAGCALERDGLFATPVGGAAGASPDAGNGGEAGAGGVAGEGGAAGAGGEAGAGGDAGNGGSAGAGGEAGNGGSAGAGGDAGNGGEAGAGGDAGVGGTAGAGGEAGQGGTAGAGGEAGAGGNAGNGGSAGAGGQAGYPTCTAGDPGTADNVIASGETDTGLLLHYDDGSEGYWNTTPAQPSFTGEDMPGQMVLAGWDGIQFELRHGGSAIAKPWYKAVTGLPGACGGPESFKAQACLTAVAKSFRCQYTPYLETTGCPPVAVTFASQGQAGNHSEDWVGWGIVLIDLTCP